MKKSVIRIGSFILILGIVLGYVNKVFKVKYSDGIYSVTKFYELEDDTVDVLILGSSHAFENFNTGILWDEYGIASYILAGSLQPMWNTYYYLKEALKTQTPELIVLEGYLTCWKYEYIDDSRIHQKATEYVEGTEYYIETEHVYGYTDEPLSEPVHYDNYVFKKNEYTSIYNWENNEYSDGIGGLIETCEGDYTHDTYEYRMAKMIHECEDHMVISSVIYHYLFIETHCMIDNVAKNTFWSSADGIHWDLTKNYDNDTADGNDNNGKFTRSYGMEPQDWLNKNTKVFNASQSVWLNFVIGLNESKQAMYIALESNGAWDYEAYLKRFNDWQSCIPERCWIEDYYRKYVRPYELYGEGAYLEMLEGGKKTHQRQ